MVSIGIDVGSVATKGAVYDGREILLMEVIPTGWSPKETGKYVLEKLKERGKLLDDQIIAVVATGYGRVSLPFVTEKITEISCHGKGAHYFDPTIRTVIDIGGQDSKVIKINSQGKVLEFMMNDKCAAGTGRFLQVMANALELDVSELSKAGENAEPQRINSMCTVFAESEVISLMAEGASKESIAAGLLESVANKTYSLVSKISVEDKVFFSGGVSKNSLLVNMLKKKLGAKIITEENSQLNGAIGAAIYGWERKKK
ncbi:CoA-substrate-specific enzyme activase, putative [Anaerovirgula multivorans]|uniref:CoA-substrate-specific enzyme activase, putative n=1 Tax=Anaerovirgula multivorans TaxID=312168 RepID=A0A239L6Q4_9FIRM|nr:acyl-CoA dehydratase activase [Anaerovirgula multivorans]SNT26121.1 CoA-substrate-specific enzyme activase, putative [Anaerovirgula multivorans]